MRGRLGLPGLGAAALLVLLGAGGCLHSRYAVFEQDQFADDTARLFDTLYSGHERLLTALEEVHARPWHFNLDQKGASNVDNDALSRAMFQENHVSFFEIPSTNGVNDSRWYYFNPRSRSLVDLGEPLPPNIDLLRTGPSSFVLFRSILATDHTEQDLEITRFPFSLNASKGPIFERPTPVTSSETDDLLPHVVKDGWLLFLRKSDDDTYRLFRSANREGTAEPIWPAQSFDIRTFRVDKNGKTVVGANPEGYFRLYSVEMDADSSPELNAYSPPVRTPVSPGDLVLATALEDGRARPAVLEIPERLDLESLAALVTTHNSSVNQKRAELAAALVETGMAKLDNFPILNFGLTYETDTGFFNDRPELFIGDVYTDSFVSVLFGLVQPLLDFKRNKMRTEAARWRAEVARSDLANEINLQLTRAAEFFFEARHLSRLLKLEEAHLQNLRQLIGHYETLRDEGESLRLQTLAAKKLRADIESESSHHKRRLRFVHGRIKELTGLPKNVALSFEMKGFDFSSYALPESSTLKSLATLNHPRVQLLENQLAEAFHRRAAGADMRPVLNFAANYTLSQRRFERLTNEAISSEEEETTTNTVTVDDDQSRESGNIGLTGQLPLAWRKARRLHGDNWSWLMDALEAEKEAERRTVVADAEEAAMDFHAAQMDYDAKWAAVAFRLEEMRVLRVLTDAAPEETVAQLPVIGRDTSPSGPVFQTSPLRGDFAMPQRQLLGNRAAALTAQSNYLLALRDVYEVERDLGIRFARLWGTLGLASRLAEEAAPLSETRRDRRRSSLWLWYTKDVIENDASVEAFLEVARTANIKRVYAYLYSDSRILNEAVTREQFTHFINACFQNDIEVWGLLGEPEWIETEDKEPVKRAIRRIDAFNEDRSPLEPKIAGVKLDLEPHSIAGWEDDPNRRARLNTAYLNLVDSAKDELHADTSLWLDFSPKYLREEYRDLAREVRRRADGFTVMCYFDTEGPILLYSERALDAFEKPVEIGVELSRNAPAGVHLADWSKDRYERLRDALVESFDEFPEFTGMALHDYRGVREYFNDDGPR